jgi:VWFA-related protein
VRIFCSRTLIFASCWLCLLAFSQHLVQVRAGGVFLRNNAREAVPCDWLPTDIAHTDALHGACRFAISLRQRMPNFVCDQQTSRYADDEQVAQDLVTAVVRYEDGSESYSDIKINGQPTTKNLAQSVGLWSKGEFGGDLRAIFNVRNHPVFHYSGETRFGPHTALVFSYRISRQNDRVWELRGESGALAPGYGGELWVDNKSGDVLRFRSVADEFPSTFLIKSAEIRTDYGNVRFADGTSFVLPSESTITMAYQPSEKMRNVARFRGCHKFGTTAHLLLNAMPSPSGSADRAAGPGTETPDSQLNEEIYSILRAQAIREDAAQIEAEQRRELEAATATALARVAALEKHAEEANKEKASEENANREMGMANTTPSKSMPPNATPPIPAKDVATAFKTRANLVLVSVVLRNAKGEAIGNLSRDDFQLWNDRKPQTISSFSVETTGRELARKKETGASSAAGSSAGNAPAGATESNVAYVFDDLHTEFAELASAKSAAAKNLNSLAAGSRAAIFTTSGAVALDFTTDVGRLQAAIDAIRPHGLGDATHCPPMSYYEADQILNQSDDDAMALAIVETMDCRRDGTLPQVVEQMVKMIASEFLTSGKAESEAALESLQRVVVRTAAMTGRRSIVLASPGFLTPTVEEQQKAMSLIESAVQAGIVVNTLDVSAMKTNAVTRASTPGIDDARSHLLSQEAVALSGVMADFAHGTGGTFFHHRNDLEEGFRQAAGAPEYIYLLGFAPEKLDGKFHKLKVTLKTREKLTVQARSGYYAARPDASH